LTDVDGDARYATKSASRSLGDGEQRVREAPQRINAVYKHSVLGR
jgi:hypothetical protein